MEQTRGALQRKRKQAVAPTAEALTDQYQQAVTSRFPRGVHIKVQVRNQKGKAVLDFKGIPVQQVSKLVEVLTAELPQVREVRLVKKVLP